MFIVTIKVCSVNGDGGNDGDEGVGGDDGGGDEGVDEGVGGDMVVVVMGVLVVIW